MDEKKVKSIVTNMLMSTNNMVVPRHVHNGVDSPTINSYDINTANNQGFVFATSSNIVNLKYNPTSNVIGFITNPISTVTFEVGNFKEILLSTSDGTNSSQIISLPGVSELQSSDGIHSVNFSVSSSVAEFFVTGGGDFALQYPNATLPTAIAGMFAFDAGTFYMSLTDGSWTPVPTVPGLGGTVTSVGVNAPLTATPSPITTAGTISITQSTTSTNGYLSSTDWNTFNGKQAAGNYITALTGDITASGPGSVAATLATVNSNVGSFTNASITVNAKGLITAASNGTAPVTSVSGTANRITSTGGTTPVIDISASYVGQTSVITLGTITTGTWNGTTIAIANGGTGQTTKTAAFDAISPMTTGGDLIYGGTSGTGTRLANGTSGQFLTSSGGTAAPTWSTITPAWTTFSSTITGFSGTPTQTCSALTLGKTMFVRISITGTSNASTFTFTIPSNAVSVQFLWAQIQNNTGTKAGSMVSTRAASNIVDVYVGAGTAANTWITSGTKGVEVTMTVELA